MTRFSFSRFSFSYSSFSCFSFFRISLSCFYSVSIFIFFLFIPSVSPFTTLLFLEYWFSDPPVFHFSPVTVSYNPTALQAHAAPVLSLCFPAFRSCCLTRSFSYLSAFLSVLRAFALLSSLLPPPGSLPGYKKSPPGVSAPGGDPLSLWVLPIALGLLLFPYRSCYCSLYMLFTYRSYLLVLPDSPGSDFLPDLPAPCGLGSLSQNLNVSLIPSHF